MLALGFLERGPREEGGLGSKNFPPAQKGKEEVEKNNLQKRPQEGDSLWVVWGERQSGNYRSGAKKA